MKADELQEKHWYTNGKPGRWRGIRLMIDMGSDQAPEGYCTFAVFDPVTGLLEDVTTTKITSFARWASHEIQPAWMRLDADVEEKFVWVRWPADVDRQKCLVSKSEPPKYDFGASEVTWLKMLVHNL